jgi:hypothetical protein
VSLAFHTTAPETKYKPNGKQTQHAGSVGEREHLQAEAIVNHHTNTKRKSLLAATTNVPPLLIIHPLDARQ